MLPLYAVSPCEYINQSKYKNKKFKRIKYTYHSNEIDFSLCSSNTFLKIQYPKNIIYPKSFFKHSINTIANDILSLYDNDLICPTKTNDICLTRDALKNLNKTFKDLPLLLLPQWSEPILNDLSLLEYFILSHNDISSQKFIFQKKAMNFEEDSHWFTEMDLDIEANNKFNFNNWNIIDHREIIDKSISIIYKPHNLLSIPYDIKADELNIDTKSQVSLGRLLIPKFKEMSNNATYKSFLRKNKSINELSLDLKETKLVDDINKNSISISSINTLKLFLESLKKNNTIKDLFVDILKTNQYLKCSSKIDYLVPDLDVDELLKHNYTERIYTRTNNQKVILMSTIYTNHFVLKSSPKKLLKFNNNNNHNHNNKLLGYNTKTLNKLIDLQSNWKFIPYPNGIIIHKNENILHAMNRIINNENNLSFISLDASIHRNFFQSKSIFRLINGIIINQNYLCNDIKFIKQSHNYESSLAYTIKGLVQKSLMIIVENTNNEYNVVEDDENNGNNSITDLNQNEKHESLFTCNENSTTIKLNLEKSEKIIQPLQLQEQQLLSFTNNEQSTINVQESSYNSNLQKIPSFNIPKILIPQNQQSVVDYYLNLHKPSQIQTNNRNNATINNHINNNFVSNHESLQQNGMVPVIISKQINYTTNSNNNNYISYNSNSNNSNDSNSNNNNSNSNMIIMNTINKREWNNLHIVISISFLDCYSFAIGELSTRYSIECVDVLLEEPISIIIDPLTCICIIDNNKMNNMNELKSFLKQLSKVSFKFHHIYLLIVFNDDINQQDVDQINQRLLFLYQATNKFPPTISILQCNNMKLFSNTINLICIKTFQSYVSNLMLLNDKQHINIVIMKEKYLTRNYLESFMKNINNKNINHYEILQLLPMLNYYLAIVLLSEYNLKELSQFNIQLLEKYVENILGYDNNEIKHILKLFLSLLHVHIGFSTNQNIIHNV